MDEKTFEKETKKIFERLKKLTEETAPISRPIIEEGIKFNMKYIIEKAKECDIGGIFYTIRNIDDQLNAYIYHERMHRAKEKVYKYALELEEIINDFLSVVSYYIYENCIIPEKSLLPKK
jgi:hypothetical protein